MAVGHLKSIEEYGRVRCTSRGGKGGGRWRGDGGGRGGIGFLSLACFGAFHTKNNGTLKITTKRTKIFRESR